MPVLCINQLHLFVIIDNNIALTSIGIRIIYAYESKFYLIIRNYLILVLVWRRIISIVNFAVEDTWKTFDLHNSAFDLICSMLFNTKFLCFHITCNYCDSKCNLDEKPTFCETNLGKFAAICTFQNFHIQTRI